MMKYNKLFSLLALRDMKKSGINPMIHGFIISALVVIVAIGVEWCMGLV